MVTLGDFRVTWKRFGVTRGSLWSILGPLGGTLGSLGGQFGALWGHLGLTLDHFGVTFGCMKVALVPLSLIFRKYTFSQRILMILHINWHTLILLVEHFGVTLEHFGGTLVQLWGDFGHVAVEWQV